MKKIFLKFFGVMFLIIALTSTGDAAKNNSFELVIFHTNDMHARCLPTDERGKSIGIAEISGAVKKFKAEHPETLWLDAGDTLHGMPYINVTKGKGMVDILGVSGMDTMTPGNHDFNYGSNTLEEYAKISKVPFISANIIKKNTKKNLCQPYKIFKVNGLNVGVFGLTTPETAYKASPLCVKDVEFLNPVDVAKDMVKKLRSKCDVLIAVTHLGVNESSEFTSTRIAKEVSGIDLIVDGHSHTTLPKGLTEGNTLIVQTGCHTQKLGKVTLEIENKKIVKKSAELLGKDDVAKISPTPDKAVADVLKKIEKDNEKLLSEEVGFSDREIPQDVVSIRLGEKEIGDLAADALRWKTSADFAVINSGGIRSSLPKGKITLGDVIAIFPFGNVIEVIEVDGKTVREMLEHSVFAYPETFGGFLQVSGITFSFDPTKPVGNRVSKIYVNDAPLDDGQIYKLALPDFMALGGDGYEMLKNKNVVEKLGTCEEVLTDYLKEVGLKNIKQGRITRLKDVPMPEVYQNQQQEKRAA